MKANSRSQMTASGVAQASEVKYELQSLGWNAFQDLCATIMTEELGQTFEYPSPTKDGGRDGYFQGKWRNRAGASRRLRARFSANTRREPEPASHSAMCPKKSPRLAGSLARDLPTPMC